MNSINLTENFKISRIVQGHWRLNEWNKSPQELLKLSKQAFDLGITTFDHADIYGDYACEQLFGNALALDTSFRKKIQIVTKCGIKLLSDKFPKRTLKTYDYSYKHIISSVEKSLENFRTDYIDILLLHRPSPFFNPVEVAKAFDDLKTQGKVLYFGVSNFTPQQIGTLQKFSKQPLITNQVEISPYCLEHFENENINYFLKHQIKPMAWSPLAGGQLLKPTTQKGERVLKALQQVANELDITSIDSIIYAWLLNHPAIIIPVVGTGKIERLNRAVDALSIKLSLEQWFKIYVASTGKKLP